jgi:hypothetical protein
VSLASSTVPSTTRYWLLRVAKTQSPPESERSFPLEVGVYRVPHEAICVEREVAHPYLHG